MGAGTSLPLEAPSPTRIKCEWLRRALLPLGRAAPRQKGQMALPLTCPPYGGINANHSSTTPGSGDVRPPFPTVAMTGVPSANSGHCSPALWRHCGNLRRSARRARHCSSHYTATSPYLLRTFPSVESSNSMGTTLGSGSDIDQDKTLACRTFGTPPRRPQELPGRRRDLRKTKDDA